MKSKANGTEINKIRTCKIKVIRNYTSKTHSKSKDSNRGRHQYAVSNIEGIPARVTKSLEKGIETNDSARSPRPVLVRLGSNLSSPPILLRLLLSSRTLLASLRSLTTRSMYARGVTVNQGWREADDYPTEARVSTDVSEGGSQAVMNLRKNKFWRTGPSAQLNRNGEQAGKP